MKSLIEQISKVTTEEKVDLADVEILTHTRDVAHALVGKRIIKFDLTDGDVWCSGSSWLDNKFPWLTCSCCGAYTQAAYMKGTMQAMLTQKLCFTCLFWCNLIDKEKSIIIQGKHYMLGPGNAGGFGGTRFKIKMLATGEVIETKDLWHQGTIPSTFRCVMHDNAEFI